MHNFFSSKFVVNKIKIKRRKTEINTFMMQGH